MAWAAIGGLVAAGIAFSVQRADLGPLLTTSVLFAEVVGFTSLLSARLVFPFWVRLALPVQVALQVVTLFAGTVLGSAAVLTTQPLYSLANWRLVAVIVLVNASLAVLAGVALFTYDTMRRQIEASYATLREKERLEREVAIARDVQRELLPRFAPNVRGIEIAGRCLPAVGVGGDYYDFLPLADDRLGVVIADVAGKGIPAALLMAGIQATVRSLAVPGLSPAEVTRRLNAMLYDTVSAGRYATFFFALYEAGSAELVYSNAGHFPPFVVRETDEARLTVGGIPIGLFQDAEYGEGRVGVTPGDLLVLYTDGLVEAPDSRGREYGEDRLIDAIRRRRKVHLERLVDDVLDDVTAWKGTRDQHDDVTLVVARIR